MAEHILALLHHLPGSQLIVFIERNIDDTRPTRVEEVTWKHLRQHRVGRNQVFFARSPYKSRPTERGTGVYTDHHIKCWSVYHTNQMMYNEQMFVWRQMVCKTENVNSPKLENLKMQMEHLEWVPIRSRAGDDDGECSPSGKEHGADDVTMSLIFLALWMAVHHSTSATLRMFNPLSVPIPFPTVHVRKIVDEQRRFIFPSENCI